MPGPGKSLETFRADNSSCKSFSADQVRGQAEASNNRAVGTAVLATVLGVGLGAATGGLAGNAGGGAGFGAAMGAGTGATIGATNSSYDQANIQGQYDNAFSQCMYAKGHIVPGYAPIAVARSSGGAAPDPLIRATQAELIRTGYLRGAADGFSGPRTRSAIVSFEQANGMPAGGMATPRLLAKLQGTSTNAASSTATATATAPPAWVAPASPGTPAVVPISAPAPVASAWVAPTTH